MSKIDTAKVLAMPINEQFYYLHDEYGEVISKGAYEEVISAITEEGRDWTIEVYFADLAFRLRDEVCGEVVHFLDRFGYEMQLREVYEHCKGKHNEFLIWLICESQPIHWILAAILAKEQSR